MAPACSHLEADFCARQATHDAWKPMPATQLDDTLAVQPSLHSTMQADPWRKAIQKEACQVYCALPQFEAACRQHHEDLSISAELQLSIQRDCRLMRHELGLVVITFVPARKKVA